MMSGSPRATAVTTLVSRTNGGAVTSLTGELLVDVSHHAGYPAGICLVGLGLPQAPATAVPVGLLGHRLVESRGHRRRVAGCDETFSIGAEVWVYSDGEARLPVTHTRIIPECDRTVYDPRLRGLAIRRPPAHSTRSGYERSQSSG